MKNGMQIDECILNKIWVKGFLIVAKKNKKNAIYMKINSDPYLWFNRNNKSRGGFLLDLGWAEEGWSHWLSCGMGCTPVKKSIGMC